MKIIQSLAAVLLTPIFRNLCRRSQSRVARTGGGALYTMTAGFWAHALCVLRLAILGVFLCAQHSLAQVTIYTVETVGMIGQSTSIAIGADGLPVISYSSPTDGNLRVAKCGNANCSFGNTISIVDYIGIVEGHSSIAIGADALPVISYRDETNAVLKVAKCGNAACSAGNTLMIVDSSGDVGWHNTIRIGADGLPVISYYDATNRDLKVAKCGNAACSAGNTITAVDTAGDVGRYTSIAIGTDGFPVISYTAFDTSFQADLKVLKCGNVSCSASNTITIVDSAGNVGHYTSVAIGTDGRPVISYGYATGADLKVAKCANAACTGAATITTVDAAGIVGSFNSIAVGPDSLPVISYSGSDSVIVWLKMAKCGNAACSAGNTVTVVDSVANAGYFTSIAIGADGLPVMSYFRGTSGQLKVAKCGNAACTGAAVVALARRDFNADGKSDILWRESASGLNAIWQMDGTTLAASALIPSVAAPWTIAGVGDFDADGKADILWRNTTTGENAIWLMNGFTLASGALIPGVPAPSPDGWFIFGVGDFNGDGNADILWRNTSTGENAIWLMNGTVLASSALIPSVPTTWSIVGVGDFDGNGKADILWRDSTGQDAIWLMNGFTLASGALIASVPTTWSIAGVGDFDGDGKADILWRDSTGQNAIWLMNGTALASSALIPSVPTTWSIVGAGDYNGDGKADILWRDSTGQDAIWLMNGFSLNSSALIPGVPTSWSVINTR